MATTSTGATGCVTSIRPALRPNRTWWRARTAGTSSFTPSDRWSPARSYWCGTATSLPRGSAASRVTPNQVSAAHVRIKNNQTPDAEMAPVQSTVQSSEKRSRGAFAKKNDQAPVFTYRRTCELQLIYLVMMTKMLFAVWGVPSTVLRMPLIMAHRKNAFRVKGDWSLGKNWALSPYQGCKWHIEPAVSFSGKKKKYT